MTKYINNKTTKKRNSIFKLLTSIAIVMLMSVSMILPAFAEPEESPKPPWMIGEPGASALSAITKKFDMPIGTSIPAAVFKFEVTAEKLDGKLVANLPAGSMPTIDTIEIKYEAEQKGVKHSAIIITDGDVKSALKESQELTKDVTWTAAGVYTYRVKESVASKITLAGAENEDETYSEAEYLIEFWVFEDEDNLGTYYVKYVNATIVGTHVDKFYLPGGKDGDKVDPTPDKWIDVETPIIKENFSGVIFTNEYWKSDGPGPGDPDPDPDEASLRVTKKIAGHEAENLDDLEFDFEVTVIKPSIVKVEEGKFQKYIAYVLDAKGDVVIGTDNYAGGTDTNGYFEIILNKPTDDGRSTEATVVVTLRPGEKLMFVDIHVGATVKVEEKVDSRFIPSYVQNFSGSDVGQKGSADDSKFGFPNTKDGGPHYLPEGNETKADFTNTRVNTTPTGLNVDDLPYIVLIGLAIVGLAGLIAYKARGKSGYDV